jgi:hypothetical protein
MPRQSNGYDCGVYVLAVARAVCEWWAAGVGWGADRAGGESSPAGREAEWEAMERRLHGWLTPGYVTGLRREMRELVRAKAALAAAGPGSGPES